MLSDVRYAFRTLRKSPGFSGTVIATLALGIGACTLMFSIVKTVLFQPAPVPHPERMVHLFESRLPDAPESMVSPANFEDWRRLATSFDGVYALGGQTMTLTGEGEPQAVNSELRTEDASVVAARSLAIGRGLEGSDYQPGSEKVVVLHHNFWMQAFGGSPTVLNRKLMLDGAPHTVVGVLKPLPGRVVRPDVSLPFVLPAAERVNRSSRNLVVQARLKAGVPLEQAAAELKTIAEQLSRAHPETNQNWGILIAPSLRIPETRDALWAISAAVACVLLIGCANIANLLLARATARQREMAIRAALGGTRTQQIRQSLCEILVLAAIGGAAGLLLANWGIEVFQSLAPAEIVRSHEFKLETPALVFAAGLSLLAVILSGIAPALLSSRTDLMPALKTGVRGGDGGSATRLRGAMVALQVGCAVTLLSGAGLLLRSFVRLSSVNLGFQPVNSVGITIVPVSNRYRTGEQRAQFVESVLERMRAVPGVEAAGAGLQFPISASRSPVGFMIEGHPLPRANWPGCAYYTATPGYFRATGMRLVRGRDIAPTDTATSVRVVVVNETLVRRHFPGEDPIGRRIKISRGGDGWREIVGVVSDIKQDGLGRESSSQVYDVNAQGEVQGGIIVVRYRGDAAAMLPRLKQQVYAVDPVQPIRSIVPMQTLVDQNIAMPRFVSGIAAIFAVLAAVIAALGIYGVMAYTVGQRTVEFGIRMALGATAGNLLRDVLQRGARMIALGLVVGIAGALTLGPLIRSMLFQVGPHDPLTLVAIVLAVTMLALLACVLPAQRASRVDPLIALRNE